MTDYITQGHSQTHTQDSNNGLSSVPKDLTEIPQWVFWRYAERDDGPTKEPYDPHTNRKASVDGPETWGTFEQAVVALSVYEGNGVGFVFSEDDTLVGIDLDDCIDPVTGALHPDAQAIIDELNSYTEISPSGTGVKVFVYGHKPSDRCRTNKTPWGGDIEIYDVGRFFTVTGNHLQGTPLEVCDAQDVFVKTYERFFGIDATTATGLTPDDAPKPPSHITADDVIAKAINARNGDAFKQLFYSYPEPKNPSETDGKLEALVIFYTGRNLDLAEDVMRRSNRVRDKWDSRRPGLDGEYTTWLRRDLQTALQTHLDRGGDFCTSWSAAPSSDDDSPFKTGPQLKAATPDIIEWDHYPTKAKGTLNIISGKQKDGGKTTYETVYYNAKINGGTFLGRPVNRGKVVYLTEQSDAMFRNSLADPDNVCQRTADLLDSEDFVYLAFHRVAHMKWPEVVDLAVEKALEIKADTIVVDTFSHWAGLEGEEENNSGAMLKAAKPLRQAVDEHGLSIDIVHHERKSGGDLMDRLRGAGALGGIVDQIISLQPSKKVNRDTARDIETRGRFAATPKTFTVELTHEGYKWLGKGNDAKRNDDRQRVWEALPISKDQRKRKETLLEELGGEIKETRLGELLKDLEDTGNVFSEKLPGKGGPIGYWRRDDIENPQAVKVRYIDAS